MNKLTPEDLENITNAFEAALIRREKAQAEQQREKDIAEWRAVDKHYQLCREQRAQNKAAEAATELQLKLIDTYSTEPTKARLTEITKSLGSM